MRILAINQNYTLFMIVFDTIMNIFWNRNKIIWSKQPSLQLMNQNLSSYSLQKSLIRLKQLNVTAWLLFNDVEESQVGLAHTAGSVLGWDTPTFYSQRVQFSTFLSL